MNYFEEVYENKEELLPWQKAKWQWLWEQKRQNRLPHALLLIGICHLEAMRFAKCLGAALLCEKTNPQGQVCGSCHACHLVRAASHPDFVMIEPEQTGQMIKIDQIRRVVHVVNETPMQGRYRVIIIHPAHAMNMAAQNALLKTLEEPASNTLLILISHQSLRLSATIMSRCQKITFQKPAREEALEWLKKQQTGEMDIEILLNMGEGAPLEALSLAKKELLSLRQALYQGLATLSQADANPLPMAAQWQEEEIQIIFNLLQSFLRDMLRFKLTKGGTTLLNSDYHAVFTTLNEKLTKENLLNYMDFVQASVKKWMKLANLNRQLLLEELLIRWIYVSR